MLRPSVCVSPPSPCHPNNCLRHVPVALGQPDGAGPGHHPPQHAALLWAAQATGILAGSKQLHEPWLLARAAQKWQQQAEFPSPYTRAASLALHSMRVFQAHTHFCQLFSHQAWQRVEAGCTEKGVGRRRGLPSWAHRLGPDGLCSFSFICFFHSAYTANCPLPQAVQPLSHPATSEFLCSLHSQTREANRLQSRDHFPPV